MENLQTLYSLDHQGYSNAKARRILSRFTEGIDTSRSHSEISFSGSFRTLENSAVIDGISILEEALNALVAVVEFLRLEGVREVYGPPHCSLAHPLWQSGS